MKPGDVVELELEESHLGTARAACHVINTKGNDATVKLELWPPLPWRAAKLGPKIKVALNRLHLAEPTLTIGQRVKAQDASGKWLDGNIISIERSSNPMLPQRIVWWYKTTTHPSSFFHESQLKI